LSIIVIGGVIAIISFVLAVIGLRRSKDLGSGKGAAIGAIGLSVLAVIVSIVATIFIVVWVNSGDDIIRDGIATTSTNTEFPPQDDLDDVECTNSDGGDSALAIITITNRSGGPSNYELTVAWDDDSGDELLASVRSDFLPADESQTMRLFAPRSGADPESCRVIRIERSFFDLLG